MSVPEPEDPTPGSQPGASGRQPAARQALDPENPHTMLEGESMPRANQQKVFDFLANDPEYLKALRREDLILVLADRLAPELIQKMTPLLRALAEELFKNAAEAAVQPVLHNAMLDLRLTVNRLIRAANQMLRRLESEYSEYDDEDWWKRGTDDHEDEEDDPLS